jgi:D-arginine dehydrogenase
MVRPRVAVIGGGMAGLSCAANLADRADVTVFEAEAQPGYHSSGRSAASYIEPYINEKVQALTAASRAFFEHPPASFATAPLVSPRADVMIADAASAHRVDAYLARWRPLCPDLVEIAPAEARARMPLLRAAAVARAVSDPHVKDIDVHGLLEGFRRTLLAAGGRLLTNRRVEGIERHGAEFLLVAGADRWMADVVVDAAGAWGERVATLAGVDPVGLVPKRRTAILIAAPGHDVAAWPIVHEMEGRFYFKPDAGRVLLSPADETPSEPCDAQPEEWDVAVAVDRFEGAVDLKVTRIEHRWAGLRSFVADRMPVVGYDPEVDGFFWLVGQGGAGIQTAPAMGRLSAALVLGAPVPADLAARGVTPSDLSPERCRVSTSSTLVAPKAAPKGLPDG